MSDFKSTLLTLADDAFFELIRNYLGPIKTPFNKHDLIAKLLSFTRREEIQEHIVSLINEHDALILTAIWVLGDPTHEDLFAFLESDYGFLDLHNRLLNLEDRLLVYRDGELVRLNPEFADRLIRDVVHPSRLFETGGTAAKPEAKPWIDDPLLIALFALLLAEPELYRSDGSLRKRASEILSRQIPVLLGPVATGGRIRVDLLIDGLTGLGLVVEAGSRLRPIVHAWHRWARVDTATRLAELAGAAASAKSGERDDTVVAARAIMRTLPENVSMSEAGLMKLASAATGVPAGSARLAVQSLVDAGVLVRDGDTVARAGVTEANDSAAPQPVVVGANFELTLPRVPFADGLFIAEISELIRHDTYLRFELTKERLAKALRSGLGGAHITARLKDLAGGQLPQNVTTSIESWEEEYRSIRLHRGVVLEVHEGRRHAVEHSERLRGLIQEEFAPGLYLIDEADVPDVQDALRESGVELIPELPPAEPAGFVPWHESSPLPSLETKMSRVAELLDASIGVEVPDLGGDSGLGRSLREALARKKLPPDQAQELSQRIERKLIISETQLRSGALKPEKTEAKGLDYAGKIRVIEHTLSSGGYLEVVERTPEGDPRRRLVEPRALRKDGTELMLEASLIPTREEIELAVSKLGLVRRLRAALFTRRPGD